MMYYDTNYFISLVHKDLIDMLSVDGYQFYNAESPYFIFNYSGENARIMVRFCSLNGSLLSVEFHVFINYDLKKFMFYPDTEIDEKSLIDSFKKAVKECTKQQNLSIISTEQELIDTFGDTIHPINLTFDMMNPPRNLSLIKQERNT